jgi:hypothetical protein
VTTVATNDPRRPELRFTVRATVVSEWSLSDHVLMVDVDEPEVKTLTITMRPDRPVRILSVRSTDPEVAARIDPSSVSPGRHYTLRVSSRPSGGTSHFGNIVLATSSSITPELRIPVRSK